MASKVEEFISAPSQDSLNDLTKDQLVELAGHYKINLVSSVCKYNITFSLSVVKANDVF